MAHEGEPSEHVVVGGVDHPPVGAGACSQLPRRLWMACEVAELLRLSTKGVYALAERGALPSIKVGSRLRFNPVDILDWVSQHQRVR